MRLASVGECTIDYYRDLQKEFVGGISLNFAVHAKRCGANSVSLISRIGTDQSARIQQKLTEEGVESSCITVTQGKTARQEIILADGERIFPPGGYSSGVLEGFRLNEATASCLKEQDILASSLFLQMEPLFRQTMELPFDGWRVADFLDLSDYENDLKILEPWSERLEIAFLSGDREIVEQLRPLSRHSRCVFVVTLGSDGSVAIVNGEPLDQPAYAAKEILDSTGCGDAFQAAFTVSYWRSREISRSLEFAAKHAATVLSYYGAT